MRLVLTTAFEKQLKQGAIIQTFDVETMQKVNVAMDDKGVYIFEKSNKTPIIKVVEFEGIADGVLRLGENEQKELNANGIVKCYRSSSPKEKMSLQSQIDLGIARVITVRKTKEGIEWQDSVGGNKNYLKSDEINII